MIAYITGATGCLGRNLASKLLDDGWDVVALHRYSSDVSRLNGLDIKLVEVNLYDYDNVVASIPYGVDAIFHVAANTSYWYLEKETQWKDNVLCTRNLVKAAINKGVKRFIYTSTAATTGAKSFNDEKRRQASHYAYTKQLAELEVFEGISNGLDAVILRPCIIIGPYDYNNYIKIFRQIKSHKTMALPGAIEFCHVKDVVQAHINAFKFGKCGSNHILGGKYATWLELFREIALIMGVTPPTKSAPISIVYIVSYLCVLWSYITKSKPLITPQIAGLLMEDASVSEFYKNKVFNEIKYKPSSSIREMVTDCYNWLIAEGRI